MEYLRTNLDLMAQAEKDGIVVVMGSSDDLVEIYGAFRDEAGCYGGGSRFYLDANGIIEKPDCDCKYAEEWYQDKCNGGWVEAVWDDHGPWTYNTNIPHEKFNVMEDGEIYCIGIVFSLDGLYSTAQK